MKMVKDYINLLPREEKRAADPGGTTKVLLIIFVLAWGGAFGWQGKQAWDVKEHMKSLAWKKQALLQQLEAMYKELGITAPAGAGMGQQRSAIIYTLLGERVLWSEVFKQFSRTVPKGLWFDNLEGSTAGRAEIKIKGGAFNYLSVAEFMLAMEKSNYFERPQLLYAQKNVVQGQDVIGFEIICGIKKGGEVR
jgi:hypothetical protein